MIAERTIDWYLDRALERSGIKSDRALSLFMDMGQNAINFYRSKKAYPSQDTMIRLARIAGIDPVIALTDLNIWTSEGLAQDAYREILKKITVAFIAGCIAFPCPTIAQASETGKEVMLQYGKDTVYYGK